MKWAPFGEAFVKSQAMEGRSGVRDARAARRYVGGPKQRSGTIAETIVKSQAMQDRTGLRGSAVDSEIAQFSEAGIMDD
jgi:hypothetical protein